MFHFPAELPIESARTLIAAVRAGDFTGPETIDAALYTLGCLNALRSPAPVLFAAPPQDSAAALEDSDVEQLADQVDHLLPASQAANAVGDAEAIPEFLIPTLITLAAKVLTFFLARRSEEQAAPPLTLKGL